MFIMRLRYSLGTKECLNRARFRKNVWEAEGNRKPSCFSADKNAPARKAFCLRAGAF